MESLDYSLERLHSVALRRSILILNWLYYKVCHLWWLKLRYVVQLPCHHCEIFCINTYPGLCTSGVITLWPCRDFRFEDLFYLASLRRYGENGSWQSQLRFLAKSFDTTLRWSPKLDTNPTLHLRHPIRIDTHSGIMGIWEEDTFELRARKTKCHLLWVAWHLQAVAKIHFIPSFAVCPISQFP